MSERVGARENGKRAAADGPRTKNTAAASDWGVRQKNGVWPMKRQKNILAVGAVLLLIFTAISALTFHRSSELIRKGYLASEGSAAEDFAVLAASNIKLSDEQVARLRASSYADMRASEENEMLRAMMNNDNFENRVDYAYVMIHLKSDEVAYDTFGHEIGDQVLLEIGEILREAFGKSHVVRFGGEEFVAGVWLRGEQELEPLLERLFCTVRAHKFTAQQISITLSLGCCYASVKELNGWQLSAMLKTADEKLYAAKEQGRDRYLIQADAQEPEQR